MKTIFLTGSTGVVGINLSYALLKQGYVLIRYGKRSAGDRLRESLEWFAETICSLFRVREKITSHSHISSSGCLRLPLNHNILEITGYSCGFVQSDQPNPTTNPSAKDVNLFFREPLMFQGSDLLTGLKHYLITISVIESSANEYL